MRGRAEQPGCTFVWHTQAHTTACLNRKIKAPESPGRGQAARKAGLLARPEGTDKAGANDTRSLPGRKCPPSAGH